MNTEKQTLENIYEGMCFPNDQSASVCAAVIGSADPLIEDRPATRMGPAAPRRRNKSGASTKKLKAEKSMEAKKLSLALLQEKHALWLK